MNALPIPEIHSRDEADAVCLTFRPDQLLLPPSFRILIVEDDPAVRDALAEVLRGENYEVSLAANAPQAMASFAGKKPDLMLMDLNLPGMDGWAVLGALGRDRIRTPVIVITARPHQYEHAVDAGIDALMEKPLDFPLLLGAISRFLQETMQDRMLRLYPKGPVTVDLSRTQSVERDHAETKLIHRRRRGRGPLDE
jgi:CheY-like chemotaxis protein